MQTMKLFVTSENPVKLSAVEKAFSKVFPGIKLEITARKFPDITTSQPLSKIEGFEEAIRRIEKARELCSKVDYYVSLEGAIEKDKFGMQTFGVVVITDAKGKKTGRATTPQYYLPKKVAELVDQGYELGTADDIVFGRVNSKQQNGAAGLLTKDIIKREDQFVTGTILALIPFINPRLY
jgi:inosine/xanthosine triphosphatase